MIDILLLLAIGYFAWVQGPGAMPEPPMAVLDSAPLEAIIAEPPALEPVSPADAPSLQSDSSAVSPDIEGHAEPALTGPVPGAKGPSSPGN